MRPANHPRPDPWSCLATTAWYTEALAIEGLWLRAIRYLDLAANADRGGQSAVAELWNVKAREAREEAEIRLDALNEEL